MAVIIKPNFGKKEDNNIADTQDLSLNEVKLLRIYKELPPIFQSNLMERAEAFKCAQKINFKKRN